MSLQLHKKSILKKTFQFGFYTFMSRILGMVREVLQVRLLGVSALSDAFIIAYRIPLSLRKIFAEGALSAAFVPTFVKISKAKKTDTANRLMTMGFLFFEGIILLLTIFVWIFPEAVIKVVASGFSEKQILPAVMFLKILFPFIFFISSGALLAGALQSVNHFFMPAFHPVLLNIVYISALLLCLQYNFSLRFLCFGILFGGFVQLAFYFYFYFKEGFGFKWPDAEARKSFKSVLVKFWNCLLGVGVMELNMIIDGNIGSYLSKGSVTVLYYGTRFMLIPLSVIAIAFSTVLLSHLSRVVLYAPKRLSVYLLEASKFVAWAMLPASLYFMFISEKLFTTIIMSKNVSVEHMAQSAVILIIMCCGLMFFAINKVLSSVFYALGDTFSPALAGGVATVINLLGNLASLFFLGKAAIYGIALSTVAFGVALTVFSFYLMHKKHKYQFYAGNFLLFLARYLLQVLLVGILFFGAHYFIFTYLQTTTFYSFFYYRWGYWFISLPLAGIAAYLLFHTKKLFKIDLYFLGK